jgi:hypothetical protein
MLSSGIVYSEVLNCSEFKRNYEEYWADKIGYNVNLYLFDVAFIKMCQSKTASRRVLSCGM